MLECGYYSMYMNYMYIQHRDSKRQKNLRKVGGRCALPR